MNLTPRIRFERQTSVPLSVPLILNRLTQLVLLACLICCSNAAAQTNAISNGAAGGKTSAGVAESQVSEKAGELGFDIRKLESISRNLSSKINQGEAVGCSALVCRNNEEVYFGQWGYQNQRKQVPLKRNTIFRIYSMSKPITSIAAMQLVEKGKLDLDAPITVYLPEFAELKVLADEPNAVEVAAKRKMTTRDLMRHTSGLTYGFFGNTKVDQKYRNNGVLVTDLNLKSTVGKLAKIPLLNHPGTKFHYSASTDVLGRVVEVVSKQPLDEYLKTNIFDPLEMSDTFFSVPTEKQDRFAELYKPDKQGTLAVANPIQSIRFYDQSNAFFSGGGGLCSTIDDYLKFCQMLLAEGNVKEKQIIKSETMKQIFSNQLVQIEQSPGRQFKFGLGFRIFPEGDYGWGGAAGTRFWVNPDKDLAIIFMTQIMPYGRRNMGESVRDAVYSAMR